MEKVAIILTDNIAVAGVNLKQICFGSMSIFAQILACNCCYLRAVLTKQ